MSTALLESHSNLNGHLPPYADGGIECRTVIMTPEMALFYLENCRYWGQRKVRRSAVLKLRHAIQRGKWDASLDKIQFCLLDGKLILVNGQHRLTAIVESGTSVIVEIAIKTVKSRVEVNERYRLFDTHLSRNKSDIMRAQGIAEEFGLSDTRVSKIAAAATWIDLGFARGKASELARSLVTDGEFQTLSARNWAPYGVKFFQETDGGDEIVTRSLTTKPVLGVALVTMKHCPDKARHFWSTVAENDGLRRGEPAHTLIRFLNNYPRKAKNEAAYCRYVASAWNAFFLGRRLEKLYGQDGQKQILIEGTPYNGNDLIIAPYLSE